MITTSAPIPSTSGSIDELPDDVLLPELDGTGVAAAPPDEPADGAAADGGAEGAADASVRRL